VSEAGGDHAEATQWRRDSEELLAGLSVAIQRQLARWEATPAETEVALLLLKGLSLREVVSARGTSERTAREQARAVYRKSGLGNRAELSAFFLEDLLPPSEPTRGGSDPALIMRALPWQAAKNARGARQRPDRQPARHSGMEGQRSKRFLHNLPMVVR